MPLNIRQVPFANLYAKMVVTTLPLTINADCNGYVFRYEGSSNVTVTIPGNLPLGFNCGFVMWGTGTITLAPGSGATNRNGKTTLTTQFQSGTILVTKNASGAAAEYLPSGDFVAVTKLPFIVSAANPDGVTENASRIAAEIASLGAQGGTIWFPPGTYQCTNLSVPGNITLRGSHSTIAGISTRLQAAPGSGLPVLSIKGVSGAHIQNIMVEDMSLYGPGNGPVVDAAYTTYLRFYRCSFLNSTFAGLQLLECWDSRVIDCDFEFCGASDGSIGAINCLQGTTDFTNSLVVNACRFESFFGAAIKGVGNTNKLFLTDLKMESASSVWPFIDLNNCVHVSLDNIQLTAAGSVRTIPSLVSIVNCYGVFGQLSFERVVNPIITNYMVLTNSRLVRLYLFTMLGAPEPTGGKIVNWDGSFPDTTKITCQTNGLTSPLGLSVAVTQLTSRTTGVTANATTGAITLFAAAPVVGTPVTFTLTDSAIAATDVVLLSIKTATNTYEAIVTAVAAGSCNITVTSLAGTASDSPVINFTVVKTLAL